MTLCVEFCWIVETFLCSTTLGPITVADYHWLTGARRPWPCKGAKLAFIIWSITVQFLLGLPYTESILHPVGLCVREFAFSSRQCLGANFAFIHSIQLSSRSLQHFSPVDLIYFLCKFTVSQLSFYSNYNFVSKILEPCLILALSHFKVGFN